LRIENKDVLNNIEAVKETDKGTDKGTDKHRWFFVRRRKP
jgi:hypothetical protein